MQSRTVFFEGTCVLLAVCFFGLTTAEQSYAQRGGGRSSSGSESRSAPSSAPRSGGDRPTFTSPSRSERPATQASQQPQQPRTAPQRPAFAPPEARPMTERPRITSPETRLPNRLDTPRPPGIGELGNRFDPRSRPGSDTFRGPQRDNRFTGPSGPPGGRPDIHRDDRRPPQPFTPSRSTINDVQRHFSGYNHYWTNDWYRRHPGSWNPVYIPSASWWYRPTWYDTWAWYGPGFFTGFVLGSTTASRPYYPYYYGNNIVYRGDMVYVNGVPYVSAADYYSQALILSQPTETVVVEEVISEPIRMADEPILDAPAQEQTKPVQGDESAEWMPMGTFAFLDDATQKESSQIIQLATNKHGRIRGNYVDEATGETKPLQGAVDPKSQRVAFQFVGDDKTVVECGLWNLTQDSVPILVHLSEERTEQKTLIRLTRSEETETELAP